MAVLGRPEVRLSARRDNRPGSGPPRGACRRHLRGLRRRPDQGVPALLRRRSTGRAAARACLTWPVHDLITRALREDRRASADELAQLDAKLDASLASSTGHHDARPLAIVMREDDTVVAGIHGLTWGDCCELVTLWVDAEHRGNGVAERLLGDAEREATRRGCSQVVLFTHASSPPRLYLRLGYEVVGFVPGYASGAAVYWLSKS